MSRELRLSPLEGEILAQVSEAGCEEVTVVMNGIPMRSESEEDREVYLHAFADALRRLFALKQIELVSTAQTGYPVIPGDEAKRTLELSTWVRWERNGGYWKAGSKDLGSVAIARCK